MIFSIFKVSRNREIRFTASVRHSEVGNRYFENTVAIAIC